MASTELEEWHVPTVRDEASVKENGIVNELEKHSLNSSASSTDNVDDEWIYPHPTDFKLTEQPIDEVRELKVAVIGMFPL